MKKCLLDSVAISKTSPTAGSRQSDLKYSWLSPCLSLAECSASGDHPCRWNGHAVVINCIRFHPFTILSVIRSALPFLVRLQSCYSLHSTHSSPAASRILTSQCAVRWAPNEQLLPQPQRRAAVDRRYAAQCPRCRPDWSCLSIRQTTPQTAAPGQHIHRRQQWRPPCCHQSRHRAANLLGRRTRAERLHWRQLAERKQATSLSEARQQL